MSSTRRQFIHLGATAAGAMALPRWLTRFDTGAGMYGLIGSMKAIPGQRDQLIRILLAGTGEMPGCLSYVAAKDPTDEQTIWITEVWESERSHAASLALPAVRDAIARGRPLIESFGQRVVTEPVGGAGLAESL